MTREQQMARLHTINLNSSDISDVIIQDDYMFINAMSGQQAKSFEAVIRNRHFIVLHINHADNASCLEKGFYVKADKNKLYIIEACFELKEAANKNGKWHWVETARKVITKSNELLINDDFEEAGKHIDICGQQAIVDINNTRCLTEYSHVSGAQRAALDFYKGPVFKYYNGPFGCDNKPRIITFNKYPDFSDVVITMKETQQKKENQYAFLDDLCDEYLLLHGGVPTVNRKGAKESGVDFVKNDIMLPLAASDAIKEYVSLWKDASNLENIEKDKISIIQKDGGVCVQRTLLPVVIWDKEDRTEIRTFEIGRYYFPENFLFNESGILFAKPIWVSPDLKGTVMEYTRHFVDDWITAYKQCAQNIQDIQNHKIESGRKIATYFMLSNASSKYSCKYFTVERLTFVACAIGADPVLEKASKICIRKTGNLEINMLCKKLIHCRQDANQIAEIIFGKLNREEKNLNKILNMPKGMLEKAMKMKVEFSDLRTIKECFICTQKGKKLFMSLNKDDIKELLDFVLYEYPECSFEDIGSIFSMLLKNYGVKNWKAYIEFLEDKFDEEEYSDYEEYYDYLASITKLSLLDGGREMVKQFAWQLNADEIDDELKGRLQGILFELKYKDDPELKKQFEDAAITCKNSYSFSDNTFEIAWPKKPEDLIKEGIMLHHCARTFIGLVAKGKTTILFVREIENPDKPFFTMEVRENKLIQCHGFDNHNLTRHGNEDVRLFVKSFCEAKNIEYSDGTELIGGEDDFL